MTDADSVANDPLAKARATAMKLLARREHSRLELDLKLRQRRCDAGTIVSVLDEFEREGWLDDERFADIYVRQRCEAGYGPQRIQAELQQRGIEGVPASLAAVPEAEWRELALRMRFRRFGREVVDDWNERGRQGRYLAQRGFTMEQIDFALTQSTGE